MIRIKTTLGKNKVSADYEDIPDGFPKIFTAITYVYFKSFEEKFTPRQILDLFEEKFPILVDVDPMPMGKNTHGVFLTGGKDSVHCLIRCVEEFGAENCHGIYLDKVNRSECHYEKRAVISICKKLGVKHHVINAVHTVKNANRTGHNIGCREQLIYILALPIIHKEKISDVYFGLTHATADLVTDTPELIDFVNDYANKIYGTQVKWHKHIDFPNISEPIVIEHMVRKYPDILDLTSSCYAQLNWREQMNKRLENVFETRIYHGCGYCVKCLRINAGILAFGEKREQVFENWLRKLYREKHAGDETVKKILDL